MAELEKHLIIIAGPTGIGKTSLSIELANFYRCPIISFDSRQFYREMTIGTAKPSEEELSNAEHHFIDSRSVKDVYTSGMFETDAINKLDELFRNHSTVIAVGGSGLYINALIYGIDDIPADEKVRDELYDRWQREGLESLQQEVKEKDPSYFETADMKNPRRVMRALEVFQITGKTYSSYRKKKNKKRAFTSIWIGLEEELGSLYERINSRVDSMVEQGLIEEVISLKPHWGLKALKTVGYREIIDFLCNKTSRDEAIELVKRNSRRYARKQFTWFRKNKEIEWFSRDQTEEIINYIQSKREN